MRIFKLGFTALFIIVTITYLIVSNSGSGNNAVVSGPTISCPDEVLEVSVQDSKDALLAGVTATDKEDGDLTGEIMISGVSKFVDGSTVKVTYLVFDSDDHMATRTRTVRYTDYQSPRFSITAPLIYTDTQKEVALIDRIRALDVIDGDITGFLRVSSDNMYSEEMIHMIKLQVTNSMGDTSVLSVPVIVQEADGLRPVITLSEQLVYLSVGSAFDAKSYFSSVTLPDGHKVTTGATITGTADTSAPGVHYITYNYNHNGHIATAVLTVVVE